MNISAKESEQIGLDSTKSVTLNVKKPAKQSENLVNLSGSSKRKHSGQSSHDGLFGQLRKSSVKFVRLNKVVEFVHRKKNFCIIA